MLVPYDISRREARLHEDKLALEEALVRHQWQKLQYEQDALQFQRQKLTNEQEKYNAVVQQQNFGNLLHVANAATALVTEESAKASLIGKEVSVYWDGEKKYFKGRVVDTVTVQHTRAKIEYFDGDVAWEDDFEEVSEESTDDIVNCMRNCGCSKPNRHRGRCDKKRSISTLVNTDTLDNTDLTDIDESLTGDGNFVQRKSKRPSIQPQKLGNDDGWAFTTSRYWRSL